MTLALDDLASAVVDGMDEAAYRRHPALSSSGVRDLLPPSTPAKFKWKRDNPSPPTPDMEFGTAFHREVLGVGQGWETAPGRWQSNRDKEIVADIRARGLIPLKPDDVATLQAMAAAVRAHPDAGPLLDPDAGVPERAIFWTDPTTGVRCRALIDFSLHNGRAFIDLKSARNAAPTALPRVVADRKYHIQADWYLDGGRALGLADESTQFIFVFVEKEPPYGVTVARLYAGDLAYASRRCALAREIFRDCSASGIWPSYPPGIHEIRLPPWSHREDDEYL